MATNFWKSLKAAFGWTIPAVTIWTSIWSPKVEAGRLEDGLWKEGTPSGPDPVTFSNTLNANVENIYAAHRSHSSHSSHRSHSSHYSSSGGSGYSPSVPRSPSPIPPSSTTPSLPSSPSHPPAASTPAKPETGPETLASLVLRVQMALSLKGYKPGGLDGVLGPQTRTALQAFQRDQGLPATGRMETATLDALGIKLP
jgi:His-Xaa-Ser repeat protein HxsA